MSKATVLPFESAVLFGMAAERVKSAQMNEPPPEELDLPPLKEPPRTAFQRWMSRLAMSFVLIAAFLIWKGANIYDEPVRSMTPGHKQLLCYFGAGVSGVLALIGMRERHRRR